MSRAPALGALAAAVAAAAWTVIAPDDAALALLLVAGALIVAGAAWLENGTGSSKELVYLSAAGRFELDGPIRDGLRIDGPTVAGQVIEWIG